MSGKNEANATVKQSRTKYSIKNINYSFLSFFISLLLQFINRTVFIRLLTSTYLGLNGLFSNVLSFLAITELGVGSAINYALYRPIAEENTELVKSLMQLYRSLYRVIGFVILIVGGILTPFLSHLIQDMPQEISHIHIYYLLYLVNSGVSYFFTYKRSLIICSQKEFISTVIATLSKIVLCVLQILILVISHSYMAYLVVAIIVTIGENLLISVIAERMFPYLKSKSVLTLPEKVASDIKKNVFAMMFHKLGTVIVFSTDNIIISKFVGLVSVGLYSNYMLVINTLNIFISKIFTAITASVGNLVLSNDKGHVEKVLYRVLFLNFWIRGFCAISLVCLLQPFVSLWIGGQYLLSYATVIIITVNFYIGGMRTTVNIFKDASGMFWYDRYRPLIESILNLVLSIPLVVHYGVAGVLMGTIGSTILIPFWFEAYVLFKQYFGKGIREYLIRQILYGIITFLTGVLCWFLCSCVSGDKMGSFILQFVICVVVPNVVFIVVFFRTKEFTYYWNLVRKIRKKLI